jgi:diphosphoinositol-polyphosphate diphosphatase
MAAGLRLAKDVEQHTQPQEPLPDHKPHKSSPETDSASPDFVPRAIYHAHQVRVRRAEQLADWPEREERGERVWLPLAEARERIAWRKDIAACLARASFP